MGQPTGTIENVLLELDVREIMIDGVDWTISSYWERVEGSAPRTYVLWTRKGQNDPHCIVEVEPAKLHDVITHPMLHLPDEVRGFLVPSP